MDVDVESVETAPIVKILDHGFVELVERTGHLTRVVDAARCSYGSSGDHMGERDRNLVRFLLGNGHTSPFRHFFFTFHIKAPLFVFRQWWKYQVGSTWREYELGDNAQALGIYHPIQKGSVCAIDIQIDTDQGCSWNELSGRYKVMDPEFYIPEKARRNNGRQSSLAVDSDNLLTSNMQLRMGEVQDLAIAQYEKMLEEGVARELARLVLPPTIYSEAYWTVSLQAVLHFLEQRLKEDAQFEIRQYAQGILELCKPTLSEMGIEVH